MSRLRSGKNPFAGIPNRVIEQKDFATLKPSELRLLIMFAYQYRGNNNGKLCAVFSQAQKFGVKSEQSLSNAIKGLLLKEYIQVTKGSISQAHGRTAVFYAVTWEKIDEIKNFNMDIEPTNKAYRTFIDDIDNRIFS